MSTKDEKQYGLILPNKNKTTSSLGIRKLNPLQDSDDELEKDEESTLNWVEASLKKSAGNSGQQNLQKRLVREALEEDASVFQYDEIYDEMQANKTAQIKAKKQAEEKKPKYIQNILKQAEKRKLEGERRTERKVQKEREDEGEMFADKESFVTPSYLKKMEELKKAEAEAKLEEMREEKLDVMKHRNFGAFYNHLFKQKMGESEVKKELSSDGDEDSRMGIIKKREDPKRQKHYRTQRDLSESPERESRGGRPKAIKQEVNSSDSDEEKEIQSYRERREKYRSMENKKDDDKGKAKDKDDKSRERGRSQERARDRNRSDDKGKNDKRDKKHGRDRSHDRDRGNRGRHRSRSRDRHRRNSRSKSPPNKRDVRKRRESSRSRSPQRSSKNHDKSRIKEEPRSPDRRDRKERKDDSAKQEKDSEIARKANVKVKKESELEEKEKRMERIRKLFAKRTVGEKFDQALQRFYIRKAEREANG